MSNVVDSFSVYNIVGALGGLVATVLLSWLLPEFVDWLLAVLGVSMPFGAKDAMRLWRRHGRPRGPTAPPAAAPQAFSAFLPPIGAPVQESNMGEEWHCYYRSPVGRLRTTGVRFFLALLRGAIFFAGLVLSASIVHEDLISAVTSLSVVAVITLFGLVDAIRCVFYGYWILMSGSLRVGDWVTSGGVSGVVVAFNLMDTELCQPAAELRRDDPEFGSCLHVGDDGYVRWHVSNTQLVTQTRGVRRF